MEKIERYTAETAAEYAFRVIKEGIVSLKLKPDTMISEKNIATGLGISRTPVREALNNLSQTRIVEIIPQTGIYITKVNYDLVEEARFIRLQLELGVMEKLSHPDNGIDLSKVEQNIKLQEFYMTSEDLDNFFVLDNEFHELLFELANKPQTYNVMRQMQIHFDRVRRLKLEGVEEAMKLLNDHKNIYQAIKSKDKEKSIEQMTLHLSRYEIDRKYLEKKYMEYFK